MTEIRIAKNGFFVRPLSEAIAQPSFLYPNPPEFQGFRNRHLTGTIDQNGIDHCTLVLDPSLNNPQSANISGTQDLAFTWDVQSTYNGTTIQGPNIYGNPERGTPEGDKAYDQCYIGGSYHFAFWSSYGGYGSGGNLPNHEDLLLWDPVGHYIHQGLVDPPLRLFPIVGRSYYAQFRTVVGVFDPQSGINYFGGYLVILYLKLITRQLNEVGQIAGTSKSFYFGATNQVVEFSGSYLKNYVADVFEQSTGPNNHADVIDYSPPTTVDNSTFTQSIHKKLPINELGTAISYTKLTSKPPSPNNSENEVDFLARDDAQFGDPVQSIISDQRAIAVVDKTTATVRDLDLSQDPNTQYDIRDLNNYASFNPKEFSLGKNSLEVIDDVILKTWEAEKAFDPEPKTKTIRFAPIPGTENFTVYNSDVKYLNNSVSFLSFDVGSKKSITPPVTETQLGGGGGGTET